MMLASSLLAGALLTAGGCNLALDLSQHPYPYVIIEPGDTDDGDSGQPDVLNAPDVVNHPDVPDSDVADAPEPDVPEPDVPEPDVPEPQRIGPRLVFSELMIRTSTPGHSTQELGEYIEVKNVGDQPADPRKIIIDLVETSDRIYIDRVIDSPGERAMLESLQPIAPGGYFVFVREDSDYYRLTHHLPVGSYYEYGVWNRSVGLSNQTRSLRLLYEETAFEYDTHDEVGWRDGSLIDMSGESDERLELLRDVALGLRASSEYEHDRRSPEHWCYHPRAFSAGPLLGSPGAATPGDCI